MKRLLLLLLCLPLLCTGATKKSSDLHLKNALHQDSLKIVELDAHIKVMNERLDNVNQLINNSNDVISNGFAASNRYLTVVSIALTLVGILLGVYVTRKINEADTTIADINETLKEVQNLRNEVVSIKDEVESESSILYRKLRREETLTYLKRLVEVPEDILNIATILLSRDLMPDDYNLLKQAYDKLPEEDVSSSDVYMTVMFQHFADKLITETKLRDRATKGLLTLINGCFINDIIKSTADMCRGLNTVEYNQRLEIVKNYVNALSISKYKDNMELYKKVLSLVSDVDRKDVINSNEYLKDRLSQLG